MIGPNAYDRSAGAFQTVRASNPLTRSQLFGPKLLDHKRYDDFSFSVKVPGPGSQSGPGSFLVLVMFVFANLINRVWLLIPGSSHAFALLVLFDMCWITMQWLAWSCYIMVKFSDHSMLA